MSFSFGLLSLIDVSTSYGFIQLFRAAKMKKISNIDINKKRDNPALHSYDFKTFLSLLLKRKPTFF